MPVKQSGLGSWHPTPHTPVVFCILVNPSGAAGGHRSEGLDGCWSPRVAGLMVAPVGCFFAQAASPLQAKLPPGSVPPSPALPASHPLDWGGCVGRSGSQNPVLCWGVQPTAPGSCWQQQHPQHHGDWWPEGLEREACKVLVPLLLTCVRCSRGWIWSSLKASS